MTPSHPGALERFTPSHIDIWDSPIGRGHDALEDTDIIAIPGGNTFDLLDTLQSFGLLLTQRIFQEQGGRVYGGSAEAILMGHDIGIALEADPNDVGLQDTTAMGLLGELDVLPHYSEGLLDFARAHQAKAAGPSFAFPNRAAPSSRKEPSAASARNRYTTSRAQKQQLTRRALPGP